jgi:hypothetical protein
MLIVTLTVKFPSERGGILLHKVLVGFSNAVWVEASVTVCFPLWITLHGPAPVSQDATIDDGLH